MDPRNDETRIDSDESQQERQHDAAEQDLQDLAPRKLDSDEQVKGGRIYSIE